MADDNKNPAGDTERTSILPQSEAQATEQTEVLPTHVAQAETARMPPVTQEETSNAFAGTPLESVAGASVDDYAGDEAVAASVATLEPAPKKTSWGKRAAIAGAAAAVLSVGFGAGIITHAAVMGDSQDFYEQGYEDGPGPRNDRQLSDEGARDTIRLARPSCECGRQGRDCHAHEERRKDQAEHPIRDSCGELGSHEAASHRRRGEQRDHDPGLGGDRQRARESARRQPEDGGDHHDQQGRRGGPLHWVP